jgi:hypothetical protein
MPFNRAKLIIADTANYSRATPIFFNNVGIGLALIVLLADTMNAKIDSIYHQPGVEFQLKFIYYS